ncbi:MAG: FAD-dependent oxidoreductase [Polaromonas sp.]
MTEALYRFSDSLWVETAPAVNARATLREDIPGDVTVAGAGFAGLRVALALAEAGSHVVVVDAGDVGWSTSGWTGGQTNPMLSFNRPNQLQKLLGPTCCKQLTEVCLNSADELFSLIRRSQINCHARRHGWLRVHHGKKMRSVSRRNAQSRKRFGVGMTQFDGREPEWRSGADAFVTESGLKTEWTMPAYIKNHSAIAVFELEKRGEVSEMPSWQQSKAGSYCAPSVLRKWN